MEHFESKNCRTKLNLANSIKIDNNDFTWKEALLKIIDDNAGPLLDEEGDRNKAKTELLNEILGDSVKFTSRWNRLKTEPKKLNSLHKVISEIKTLYTNDSKTGKIDDLIGKINSKGDISKLREANQECVNDVNLASDDIATIEKQLHNVSQQIEMSENLYGNKKKVYNGLLILLIMFLIVIGIILGLIFLKK